MKKVFILIVVAFLCVSSFAQSSYKISYQAVIRDVTNSLVQNQTIGMQISILQYSPEGILVYDEVQTPTTNTNGLVSIEIGGSIGFDTIKWAEGPYFIKTEVDLSGGNNYSISGTSQLLSVPYALHAATSDDTQWKVNGDSLYYIEGNVGINTIGPRCYLQVNSSTSKTALLIENTGYYSAKLVLKQAGSIEGQAYYLVSRTNGDFVIGNATNGISDNFVIDSTGQVGINIVPQQTLHVKDVMRIEPTFFPPENPSEGDIYMDANNHKLMVFDGTIWQACW